MAVELIENASLRELNSFGVDARARWLATVRSDADLIQLQDHAGVRGLPRLVLGGGSNLLFTGDFDGW